MPLAVSHSSDPDCIANLDACKKTIDKMFVNIGYWPALISYLVFVVGLLLIPVYVIHRSRLRRNFN